MRYVATLLIGAALTAPAFANDSTAELTTGGLTLTRSADIEMRAEDLSVSENEIVVRYRFFNRGPADETVTVAFPMPDVVWEGPDTTYAFPDWDSDNFLDFVTKVDGAAVTAKLEKKAFSGAIEITGKLTALGIPLSPQSDAARTVLDHLPKAVEAELLNAKIVDPNDYDVGKGTEHHLSPHWTLKSTYYWSQTFPAGREVAVEHRYKPSVGSTVGTSLQMRPLDPEDWRKYEARYCVDKAFMAGVEAKSGQRDKDGNQQFNLFEKRIAYVLKTGANWAAPIGDFHLVVDKGAADNLISFCADGVKKISPTAFEVRHQNFTPTHDLDILILYKQPN